MESVAQAELYDTINRPVALCVDMFTRYYRRTATVNGPCRRYSRCWFNDTLKEVSVPIAQFKEWRSAGAKPTRLLIMLGLALTLSPQTPFTVSPSHGRIRDLVTFTDASAGEFTNTFYSSKALNCGCISLQCVFEQI